MNVKITMPDNTINMIIAIIIFLGFGLLWIKLSDYFLSAVDIVGHSRFSYWVRKYVEGFIYGLILAIIWIVAISGPSNQSDTKDTNTSKTTTDVKPRNDNNNVKQQQQKINVVGLDCNSENKIVSTICSDNELVEINNKYQNFETLLSSKNIDVEKLKENRTELNRKLVECNLNKQCIYFSFQEAIISLGNLEK